MDLEKFCYLLFGLAVGYWYWSPKDQFWNQNVQIYGGVTTSSPVADVWGYMNDWEGCQTLAAGANYMNSRELDMPSIDWQKYISYWSTKGNTTCVRHK